jgi:hypothetical protein
MFGSQTLEVAIGLIFIYILASIICTAVREGLEAWMKTRSVYLERGIRELLHDREGGDLAKAFYNHPLVLSLFPGDYKPTPSNRRFLFTSRGADLPTYIPSKNFALALMDLAARGPVADAGTSGSDAPAMSLDAIRANVSALKNPAVQRVLLTAIDSAKGDIDRARANIEAWYDSSMDRVSGWYKRSTQWIVFAIAIAVAVGLNINTLTVVDYLYHNDAARAGIVARAGVAAADPTDLGKPYEKVRKELEGLKLPIGWPAPKNVTAITTILGWLLTALAATLGAPFWFDVLNKVMVIRSTVKPHEKSGEEASEDRQTSAERMSLAMTGSAGATAPAPAGAVAAAAAPPPAASIPATADVDGETDGCDVEMDDPTPDEALPEAKGGVA